MQWIVGTICINLPRKTDLDPRTIFCCEVMILFAHAVSRVAQTIHREPAFGSQNWPRLLGLGESAGKNSAILFHCSNKPPAHSFLSLTTPPTGNAKEECKALQKLHSCVCTLQLPSYSARESNSINGLTCTSSDTDNVIGCSVSSHGRDKQCATGSEHRNENTE